MAVNTPADKWRKSNKQYELQRDVILIFKVKTVLCQRPIPKIFRINTELLQSEFEVEVR